MRAVFGLIAVYDDLVADLHRIPSDSAPHEHVRASGFDRPILHLAVGPLHVDIDPAMRIDQHHFGDSSVTKLDRLLLVELGREGVMWASWRRTKHEHRGRDDGSKNQIAAHRNYLPSFRTIIPHRRARRKRV